jgi:hypothetical protein
VNVPVAGYVLRGASFPASTNASKASQCRGCGAFAPARKREQAVSESPVALAIYVAADAFGDSDRPGCAVLSFDQRRVLSKPGALSSWRLPHCFHPDVSGRTLSYHGVAAYSRSDEYVTLKTKSPGQEYVVDATDDMIAWVSSVLQ